MANDGLFRAAGIVKRFCALFGPLGAVMCAAVCLGLPVVSALGVAGMNFLRDDRLLIPFEILCCGAFLWSFERGRQAHGKLIVVWLGVLATGTLMGSMFLAGVRSKTAVLFACILLTAAMALNQIFLKKFLRTTNNSPNSKD
jgi:hypothetical protein